MLPRISPSIDEWVSGTAAALVWAPFADAAPGTLGTARGAARTAAFATCFTVASCAFAVVSTDADTSRHRSAFPRVHGPSVLVAPVQSQLRKRSYYTAFSTLHHIAKSGNHCQFSEKIIVLWLSFLLQEDLFQQPGLRSEFEHIRDCLDTGMIDNLCILQTCVCVCVCVCVCKRGEKRERLFQSLKYDVVSSANM
jgi:hypothetical protein